MLKRWWLGLVFATGCACAPVYHEETTYAPPSMADSIDLCANENACTVLCSRAFYLDAANIDSCRVVNRDGVGGATVKVKYHELVCAEFEGDDYGDSGDSSDFGDPVDDDPCSDGSCDDPCSDGSCDPPPDEDPPPDDPPPDDPPPDDPPPDDPM